MLREMNIAVIKLSTRSRFTKVYYRFPLQYTFHNLI